MIYIYTSRGPSKRLLPRRAPGKGWMFDGGELEAQVERGREFVLGRLTWT